MSSENHDKEIKTHWPTMVLGLIVAAVFLVAVFSFQVSYSEVGIVTTLGKITGIKDAGIHFRWPYPIQSVEKFDNRLRCFNGNVGKLEETLTRDGKNIIVGIYIIYNISDPEKFFRNVVSVSVAEDRLNSIMRSVKDSVIGSYNFDQFINTDPAKIQLTEIEKKIKEGVAAQAAAYYGISVTAAGINNIGVPEKITEAVFNRMIEERKSVASELRSAGKKTADTLKNKADNEKRKILSDAEAKAKMIKAEGDAEAASYYGTFRQNPELAIFLRKLDSLKKIAGTKTTLVLDTDCAPFDIMKANSEKIKNESNKK